jgi:hypothetical protein
MCPAPEGEKEPEKQREKTKSSKKKGGASETSQIEGPWVESSSV